MTVQWTPPESDGGSPITSYILEMKEQFSTMCKSATPMDIKTPNMKVTGLKEGGVYEFRVSAVNKAGVGKPSPISQSYTAKPPYSKYKIVYSLIFFNYIVGWTSRYPNSSKTLHYEGIPHFVQDGLVYTLEDVLHQGYNHQWETTFKGCTIFLTSLDRQVQVEYPTLFEMDCNVHLQV